MEGWLRQMGRKLGFLPKPVVEQRMVRRITLQMPLETAHLLDKLCEANKTSVQDTLIEALKEKYALHLDVEEGNVESFEQADGGLEIVWHISAEDVQKFAIGSLTPKIVWNNSDPRPKG